MSIASCIQACFSILGSCSLGFFALLLLPTVLISCLNIKMSFMTRTFFSCDVSVLSVAVMGFGIINHNALLDCHLHDWWGVGMQCFSLSGVKHGISEPFVFHDISSHAGQLVCIKLYSFLRVAMVLNSKPCKLHKQAWLSIKYSHSDWLINGKKKTLLGGQYKARRTVIVKPSQFDNNFIFSTCNLKGNFMIIILII